MANYRVLFASLSNFTFLAFLFQTLIKSILKEAWLHPLCTLPLGLQVLDLHDHLFYGLNSSKSFRLSSEERHSCPIIVLESFQYIQITFVLKEPRINAVVRIWPHQYQIEQNTLPNAARNNISHLCGKVTLLTHIQRVYQKSQAFFYKAALHHSDSQNLLLPRFAHSQKAGLCTCPCLTS